MTNSLVDRSHVERLLLLAAALRTGMIDALADGEAATASAVAASISGDLRACRLVLEALVEVGVVEIVDPKPVPADSQTVEVGGEPRYRLTSLGRRHLVDPGPELERAWLVHQAGKARGWMDLPHIIAHGRRPTGAGHARDLHAFAHTMAEGDPSPIDEVVDLVLAYCDPLPSPGNMLDVGGGLGHVARRFGLRGLPGVVFDTPRITRIAREHLGERSAAIRFVAGDFNQSLPPGPFAVAYLGNVFHIYAPDRNQALARRVFQAIVPGGALAAVDYVWGRSPRARMFAVDMLQATDEGGVWTEDEYRGWLTAAGFEDVRIVDLTLGGNQLILGRRPRA